MIYKLIIDPSSKTFTYILGDPETKEAVVIDSVLEQVERDLKYLDELGLKPKFLSETHVHAEHISGVSTIVAKLPKAKITYGKNSGVDKEAVKNLQLLKEGDKIQFGKYHLEVFETPGHTSGCISYFFPGTKWGLKDMVFTGDCMFIRKCGRTDFQQGSAKILWHSINKLYKNMKEDCVVCPGHDYSGFVSSTIGEEKKFSIRVNSTIKVEDFEVMMKEALKTLAKPFILHMAVPANFNGGIFEAQKMYNNVYVTGTLHELSVRLMKKKYDTKHIVHIVTKTSAMFFDATKVSKELGINYIHMPMTPTDISNEKLLNFCNFMDQLKGNVTLSCSTENRTRFLAFYYAKFKKAKPKVDCDYDNILAGLKSPLYEYLIGDMKEDIGAYLKRQGKGKPPSSVCSGRPKVSAHAECGM